MHDFKILGVFWTTGEEGQKNASFRGVEIAGTPWFYRHLGLKKALLKSAIWVNSRSWKGLF